MEDPKAPHWVIIGGGAAGFFAAITASEAAPQARITILERAPDVLAKVRISGGGRCNVTHACFDPKALTAFYPRGAKALLGAFHRFNPQHTVAWFAARGVRLKTEADGRMFPETDDAETIVQCLWQAAQQAGVQVKTRCGLQALHRLPDERWEIQTTQNTRLTADAVLVATGSNAGIWQQLAELGHSIEPPVPSLFTFRVHDARLHGLAGVSVNKTTAWIPETSLRASGALLITHWGLSGPGILRLSAWGARELHGRGYRFPLRVNWIPEQREDGIMRTFADARLHQPKKQIGNTPLFGLPVRLWQHLMAEVAEIRWADLRKTEQQTMVQTLRASDWEVQGKSTHKDEFVTCGGVRLDEVNYKTMASKHLPNLYFAGEVLDVDAITGGFNFQHAWTTGWLAGKAWAESVLHQNK